MIKLLCDVDGPLRGITGLAEDQLPFTIARFLTMQAQSGQEAARGTVKGVFELRNDWTRSNIKITPAKKTTMFSEVFTDTGNRKTGAPDYLPRQEEGGERVPLAGHKFLAIPTRYLFKYTPKTRPIPDNLRPKALLPAGAEVGVQYGGSFSAGSRAGGTKRVIGKATMKQLKSTDFFAFVQVTKSGTPCIFVRHGGMGHSGSQDAEPWYTLIREAHIKARFPMTEAVEKAVIENLDRNFSRAAAEVMVNDALKNGLQVKF